MPTPATVIVFQSRSAHPAKRRLEASIVEGLVKSSRAEVVLAPHLYDLSEECSAAKALRRISGDLVVLSWLFPRAAFWTLHQLDIRGRQATAAAATPPPLADAQGGPDQPPSTPDRTIYCLDLRTTSRAESHLAEILRILASGDTAPSDESGHTRRSERRLRRDSPTPPRWYPVIDFSCCTNCLECIDFCLFGVYGVDAMDTILVEQPDNCRQGCPACSRVCPASAIMFPQHKTPGIAGDPRDAGGLKLDLTALFGGASASELALQERRRRLPEAAAADEPAADPPPKDELDKLLDSLDQFEP